MFVMHGRRDPLAAALDAVLDSEALGLRGPSSLRVKNSKTHSNSASFPMNVEDRDDAFVVTCELPGVPKHLVNLSFEKGVLTIEAGNDEQQTPEAPPSAVADEAKSADEAKAQHEQEEVAPKPETKPTKFLVRERVPVRAVRRLRLEDGVEADGISATHQNGVLEVTLPKKAPVVHKVTIQ